VHSSGTKRVGRRGARWPRRLRPASGKSTLLDALRVRGHAVVEEAATDVIAAQQARGIAEPWLCADFTDLIVALQRARQTAPVPATVRVQLFDPSPLCTLALARYLKHPVGTVLHAGVERVLREQVYECEVLVVRPLGFVVATAARRISYEDSLAFQAVHEAVYAEHGFELVDVPADSTSERVAAVEAHLPSNLRSTPTPGRVPQPDVRTGHS
jgi:predicted ATPase